MQTVSHSCRVSLLLFSTFVNWNKQHVTRCVSVVKCVLLLTTTHTQMHRKGAFFNLGCHISHISRNPSDVLFLKRLLWSGYCQSPPGAVSCMFLMHEFLSSPNVLSTKKLPQRKYYINPKTFQLILFQIYEIM